MAKFIFQLEPLLEQRRREERDRMRAVGEIERERLDLEAEAARVAAEIHAEREALRAELHRGGGGAAAVNLARVQMQATASLHKTRRTHELALRAAAVFKRLDAARADLLRATTRRRAVELLRERRHEAWLAEERAREARDMDELITARYSRPQDGAVR